MNGFRVLAEAFAILALLAPAHNIWLIQRRARLRRRWVLPLTVMNLALTGGVIIAFRHRFPEIYYELIALSAGAIYIFENRAIRTALKSDVRRATDSIEL